MEVWPSTADSYRTGDALSTYIRGGRSNPPQAPHDYRTASDRTRGTDWGVGPQDTLPGQAGFSGSTARAPHEISGPVTVPAGRPAGSRAAEPALSGRVEPAGSVDSQSLSALAWLLDDLVRIPGLNVRIGLDAVIGLVPGIGDSIGTALSSVILVSSVRYRVPMHVLLQMAWNILVDTVLGLVPGVGDVADAVHRANRKNYRLLRETVESGKQVDTDSKGYVIRAGLLVAGVIAALVAATLVTLWVVFQGLGALLG